MSVRRTTWMILLGGVAACTGAPAPPPTCDAVPEIAWRLPDQTVRSPLTLPPDESAIKAAKVLKDVVFTHARDPQDPWAIGHALLAIGEDFELMNGEPAVDWLFSQYGETFEVCGETLIRFPRSRGNIRIEPHTDLILKALTEIGITPDRVVTVQGKKLTVGHLYRGSLHRAWVDSSTGGDPTAEGTVLDRVPYGPPGQLPGTSTADWNDTPWALQGLAAWAPEPLEWVGAGGHPMTMDRFTHAAVQRIDGETQALQIQQQQGQTFDKAAAAKAGGLVSMTCGGAHMLQGTAYALGRGFGEPTDKAVYERQITLMFWRYRAELDTYTELIEQQPRYRTLIMMQRLKFLGHFLETAHKWAALGLFVPDQEQDVILREAAAQLIATVAVLQQTGIFANLDKLNDPQTPEVYPGLTSNRQLFLDYVGDSAHGYRGLDLALGHGFLRR